MFAHRLAFTATLVAFKIPRTTKTSDSQRCRGMNTTDNAQVYQETQAENPGAILSRWSNSMSRLSTRTARMSSSPSRALSGHERPVGWNISTREPSLRFTPSPFQALPEVAIAATLFVRHGLRVIDVCGDRMFPSNGQPPCASRPLGKSVTHKVQYESITK